MVALAIAFSVLALAAYGGYTLWLERQQPDDRCYWMSDDKVPFNPCLLDAPPPKGACVKMDFVYAHQVFCSERERLAEFAQKAGRRICGQVSKTCQAVVQ